jgi:hypothetical protein
LNLHPPASDAGALPIALLEDRSRQADLITADPSNLFTLIAADAFMYVDFVDS